MDGNWVADRLSILWLGEKMTYKNLLYYTVLHSRTGFLHIHLSLWPSSLLFWFSPLLYSWALFGVRTCSSGFLILFSSLLVVKVYSCDPWDDGRIVRRWRWKNLKPVKPFLSDLLNVNYFTQTDFWSDKFYPKNSVNHDKTKFATTCVNCITLTNFSKTIIFMGFKSIKNKSYLG